MESVTMATTNMSVLVTASTTVVAAVKTVTMTSCALSMFGAFCIICTYLAWKNLRSRARLLLVYLSIADFALASGYLYGIIRNFRDDSLDCILQSAVTTYANLASFLWTLCIAIYLFIIVVYNDIPLANKLHVPFHVCCWGIPLAVVVPALVLGGLGYDGSYVSVGWCWVDINNSMFLFWMLVAGKVWEMGMYCVLPVLYILMKKHIHTQLKNCDVMSDEDQGTMESLVQLDHKLLMIPIVFILLRVWSTARFMLYIFRSPIVANPILLILHGFGNSFQGGANCILFCILTKRVRRTILRQIYYLMHRCWDCTCSCACCKKDDALENDHTERRQVTFITAHIYHDERRSLLIERDC